VPIVRADQLPGRRRSSALQGAIQLHRFGGDQFLASLVGLSVVRELGPADDGDPGHGALGRRVSPPSSAR
jgi:hypothetical protein